MWNVNSLNSPNERKPVAHWLKKQKVDVLCLQEVHVRKKDQKLLENKKLGLALADKKVRGVVFYINKDLCPNKIFTDSDSRYLALEILFNRKNY